jgi:hypothetical protein
MEIDQLIKTIVSNLEKNGYPAKKVSFPKTSLEQFVKKNDYDLEDILGEMQLRDIFHESTPDKIIFSSTKEPDRGFDFSDLKNRDPFWVRQQAEAMMKNMTPEQMEDVRKKFEAMSPEEKQKIMDMAKNMGF